MVLRQQRDMSVKMGQSMYKSTENCVLYQDEISVQCVIIRQILFFARNALGNFPVVRYAL